MYTIYVVFKCFPGKREDYAEKINAEGFLSEIRREDGCVKYDLYFSEKDPNEILLIEAWKSKAHQEAHIKTPHMAKLFELNQEYIESADIGEFSIVDSPSMP